jgi:hypothetical protein
MIARWSALVRAKGALTRVRAPSRIGSMRGLFGSAILIAATALACSATDGSIDEGSDDRSGEDVDIAAEETSTDDSAFTATGCPSPPAPPQGAAAVCLRVRQVVHVRGGGREIREGVASLGLWRELPTLRRRVVGRMCGHAYDPYWHLGDTFARCRDAIAPNRPWLPQATFNRTGLIGAPTQQWEYGTAQTPATFNPIDGGSPMHLPGFYEQRWIRYHPGTTMPPQTTDRLITSDAVGGPYWCDDPGRIIPRFDAGGWLVPIALAGTATAAYNPVAFGPAIPGSAVVLIGAVVVGGVSYGVMSTADWVRSHPGGIQGRLDALAAAAGGTVCTRMQSGSVHPLSSLWVARYISPAADRPGCPKSKPGQTCCDETETYLGWLVHQTCDRNGRLSCGQVGLPCNEYTKRYSIGTQCANLRKAVNRECFGNKPYDPSDTHWQQVKQRVDDANVCRDRLMTRPPNRPKEMPTCFGNVPAVQLYP